MRIFEVDNNGRAFYLEVESNYDSVLDGTGKKDAVNFVTGEAEANELHTLISVSTEDARKFAKSIIAICDQIDRVDVRFELGLLLEETKKLALSCTDEMNKAGLEGEIRGLKRALARLPEEGD